MNATPSRSVIAMIPARYDSVRFPGKLMHLLGDKPVIRHTYEATVATGLFSDVIVVTDSEIIAAEIGLAGGNVIMSRYPHESGSDRIAEAAAELDIDVIINVQGDSPFVDKQALQRLIAQFDDESVQVASLMRQITDPASVSNPNVVKVTVDLKMNSLFFSRSPLPFARDTGSSPVYYEHIGVYAFRKAALMAFTLWPVTPLEAAEKIECLRYLEHGIALRMVLVDHKGVEIDTPEDLVKARQLIR